MNKKILMCLLAFTLVGCTTTKNGTAEVSTFDEVAEEYLSDEVILKSVDSKTIEYDGMSATYAQDLIVIDLSMDEENVKKLYDCDLIENSDGLVVSYFLSSKTDGTLSVKLTGSDIYNWDATIENNEVTNISGYDDTDLAKEISNKILEIILANITYTGK
jgi:hypothetical protein